MHVRIWYIKWMKQAVCDLISRVRTWNRVKSDGYRLTVFAGQVYLGCPQPAGWCWLVTSDIQVLVMLLRSQGTHMDPFSIWLKILHTSNHFCFQSSIFFYLNEWRYPHVFVVLSCRWASWHMDKYLQVCWLCVVSAGRHTSSSSSPSAGLGLVCPPRCGYARWLQSTNIPCCHYSIFKKPPRYYTSTL